MITGASVGIGRDLALVFAREGHGLVLTARNQAQLEELAARIRKEYAVPVQIVPQDLNQPAAAQEIFNQIASRGITIDFLVNNAGFGAYGPFAESDVARELSLLQVNIVALVHLTRLFLPGMLARKSGRILNVASTAAFVPGPFMACYYASKAFVLSFSEAIDEEIAGSGVSVTVLCPGPTTTEFQKRAGIGKTSLFSGRVMTSLAVAQIGYDALMAGKRTVIAGFRNKMLALSSRLAPRKMATAVVRKMNKNR